MRSQTPHRQSIIKGLLALAQKERSPESFASISKKRRISYTNSEGGAILKEEHTFIKMRTRVRCGNCAGLRFGDRIGKRTALSEVANNQNRPHIIRKSDYGCMQCDIHLCRPTKRDCWREFHGF